MITLVKTSQLDVTRKGRKSTKEERSRLDRTIIKLRIPYSLVNQLVMFRFHKSDIRNLNGCEVVQFIRWLLANKIELWNRFKESVYK